MDEQTEELLEDIYDFLIDDSCENCDQYIPEEDCGHRDCSVHSILKRIVRVME